MTTKQQVKDFAKAHGLYAKWDSEWQEWTVNEMPRNPKADYFTSDAEDALDQLKYLAERNK